MPLRTRPLVVAWLVLVIATLLSYWTGVDHTGTVAAALVILVTFVKVRVIGRWFMELRTAPRALARAFDAYVVVVGVALITLYAVA